MSDPQWLARYVGIPFQDKGFNFQGCSCWGLVHLVFKNELGINTPTYSDIASDEIDRANSQYDIETTSGATWRVAERPLRPFDVTLIRGNPLHVGIVIDTTRILHVWRATSSIVMPLSHPRIRERIIDHYRHRETA